MKKLLAAAFVVSMCSAAPAFAMDSMAMTKMNTMMTDHSMKMMDTNKDGMVSAAESEAGYKKMFMAADTNHDGMVSKAEMTTAMKKNMAGMGMDKKTMAMMGDHQMEMMDANGDGMISMDEHMAGAKKMFTMSDTNNDMMMSKDEMMDMSMKDMKMMGGTDSMMNK